MLFLWVLLRVNSFMNDHNFSVECSGSYLFPNLIIDFMLSMFACNAKKRSKRASFESII